MKICKRLKKYMAKIISSEQGDWMGTYADLVTLLLCFFVLLFAMSDVDEDKYEQLASSFAGEPVTVVEMGGTGILDQMGDGIMPMQQVRQKEEKEDRGEDVESELAEMASEFRTYLAKEALTDSIEIEVGAQYIKLSFDDGMLFDSGFADLKEESIDVLNMVGDELLKYPTSDIEIEGHTDNKPIHTARFPNNMYLSTARSLEVYSYLVEVKGIEPERISTQGWGEHRPVADNATPEGRAKNRRVEIKIMSEHYSGQDTE